MDWTRFDNHGESNNHAFEVMCNLLFESWCKDTYGEELTHFSFVNGDGGDGGVEAFASLTNGDIIAVQSKWFPEKIEDGQIRQIEKSFQTAVAVRPNIKEYVVCVPRDLGNKRIVRDRKVTNNTESDRWDKLSSDLKKSNPNVNIILWDETSIQEHLTRPENQGIYKYWFENTIVFDDLFKLSFEKTVNGWAKAKYIPEIHTAGYIHNQLEYFVGSIELSLRRYEEICKFIARMEALMRSYKDLLELGIPKAEKELQDNIEKDLIIISKWLSVLDSIRQAIKLGSRVSKITEIFSLNCSLADIRNSSLHFGKYFHFSEAEKMLENIEDDFFNLVRLIDYRDDNKIIFLGMQGTGKTAGIIAEAASYLQNGVHLPVIVHAKEYKEGDSWASMIIKTLGLNAEWNEIELFGALQNAAFIRKPRDGEFFIEPQCVVIVDGIDEASSWEYWKGKIEETTAFKKRFPRIKFVFLSRPYVFENRFELSYRDCFYSLPISGDGDLDEICDKYFSKYRIDIGENHWIKTNLKNPVSIKLFSDIYRNTPIVNLSKNTTVLTELYKAKISSMEDTYISDHQGLRGVKVIQTSLIELAQLFTKSSSIQYEEILDKVSIPVKNHLDEILNFLMDEGFIYSHIKQADDFSAPTTFYSWGMQPAFDYLIAQKMYAGLISGQKIEIKCTDGIHQMLSLIAIENGKLITEFENLTIDDQDAFELIYYALANCSTNVAEKYREYLKQLMKFSVAEFREIFSKVIQPVLRIDKHPLGSMLLDEFLREFDNAAERDIWWSIPSYLKDNYNSDWRAYTELDFESIKLYNTDKHTAAPLALVWSLSSVNNSVRQSSRYKLTAWGISNPLEFWKLFEKCISIDDVQVLEDIFAVSFGIALDQFICDEYLLIASKWFVENLFSNEGLKKYENVALRYYGAGVVKTAISHGLMDAGLRQLVTPPYSYDPDYLPLCRDALDSNRMGGYQAIDYDLARYVLCDRLDDYFRTDYITKEYHYKAAEFITKYETKYNLSDLKVEGFIIALAYQFILDQGWNKEKFWGYEDKDNLGIDIVIQGTYYPATHGEMSRVMTVAEKNVWLAKHKIEAIFANEIPLSKDYKTFQYVDDYSQLEDFTNTYQDYANTLHRAKKHTWFNADLLACLDCETMDKEKIERWMQNTDIPQFDKWISNTNGEVLLYTATDVQNNLSGITETVWISAGAVKKNDFQQLLILLDNYCEDRNELLNVCDFHSYQDCRCYCTPQEACLVHSEREINSVLSIGKDNSKIEIFKLVEECLSADEMETERYYIFPSKLTRGLTGIVYGDGFSYSDKRGNVIARYSDSGEKWGTFQQTLMISYDRLMSGLTEAELMPVWLFRLYREPSPKARERFDNLIHSSDKTFMVWQEGSQFRFKELLPLEPERNDQTVNVDFNLESILKRYTISGEDELVDMDEDDIITFDENAF